MGCPFDGKCRDDCETCTSERIQEKFAALIDQAMNRVDELEPCQCFACKERLRLLRKPYSDLLRTGD
jgi:hypothetical protein